MPYDQQDFEANPGKYRRFKTAVIAKSNLGDLLPVGTHVGLVFRDALANVGLAGKPIMPIYDVRTHSTQAEPVATLFAVALKDFVL